MNAFKEASLVEAESRKILHHFIAQHAMEGRFVTTDKGRLAKEMQKTVGDILINNPKGELVALELKAEQENSHGNLFIETWSNKSRFTQGWIFTLNTDVLLYHFLKQDELYVVNFQELRAWLFKDVNGFPNINKYRERPQSKYTQMNDTWGRCVSIKDLRANVALKVYHPSALLQAANEEPELRDGRV